MDATQPLEQQEEETTDAVEEKTEEVASVAQPEAEEKVLNCPTCKGEGLVWHAGLSRHEKCPDCVGTGKIN